MRTRDGDVRRVTHEIEMIEIERDKAAEAARAIEGGFAWVDTPQGASYWIEVHRNLLAIVQAASEKLRAAEELAALLT